MLYEVITGEVAAERLFQHDATTTGAADARQAFGDLRKQARRNREIAHRALLV